MTVESLELLHVGWATSADLRRLRASGKGWRGNWPEGAYAFPERGAEGEIVGFSLRTRDGRKGAPSSKIGARRGLIIPDGLDAARGPVLIVEGASDVAAAAVLGLRAVGRPSNSSGSEDLAELFRIRADVLVVGENDEKPNGTSPGREGMFAIARRLAASWNRVVRCALPPQHAKDLREWLRARTHVDLDISTRAACELAGRELLAELDLRIETINPERAALAESDRRQTVEIVAGELPRAAEHVEQLLNSAQPATPMIFQRQGTLVRTFRLESALAGKLSLESGAIVIRDATPDFLLDQAARVAQFVALNKRGDKRPIDPPLSLARAILTHAGAWPFPRLVGVVEAPQLFPDGRVLERPGHDDASGLLFDPGGVLFPTIPEKPTREEASRAVERIERVLLAGFPFLDECDRSAALAMLLSAVCRSAYGPGPAFGVTAPNRSCGKSTLLALPATLSTGRGPALIAPGASEEEADKRILSLLQDGHRHVSFDNLRSGDELNVPAVAKALTEPVYTGRPLGKTGTLSLSTSGVVWTYCGVNILPRGDTISRSVLIRLDPQEARPWTRRWPTADPREYARKHRGELVAAALTVIRAFMSAGCPPQGLEPCRFSEWDRLVRNVLPWLGRPDPLAGMVELEEQDPEVEQLATLMDAWARELGSVAITSSEVIARAAAKRADLWLAVKSVAESSRAPGEVDPRRLGHFLASMERRVLGAQRFVRAGTSGTRAIWKLEAVDADRSSAVPAVRDGPHAQGCAGARAHAEHPSQPVANCGNCADCEHSAQVGRAVGWQQDGLETERQPGGDAAARRDEGAEIADTEPQQPPAGAHVAGTTVPPEPGLDCATRQRLHAVGAKDADTMDSTRRRTRDADPIGAPEALR